MITLQQYFGAKEHTDAHAAAALVFLEKVENLFYEFSEATGKPWSVDPDTGSCISGSRGGSGDGGFRLPTATTGSEHSSHKQARGVDVYDPDNAFDNWISTFDGVSGANSKLQEHGLYREHPDATPTWVHLTDRAPFSERRTFKP